MPEQYESNMELSGSEETPTPETPAEAPTETPEETPAETPAETPETPAAEDEPILYDTPDGRKVTAEELQTEWKENFLPEFTRKSQALAEFEREKNLNNPPTDEPAWKKEGYVPENYAEVIELAKQEALAEMKSSAQAEVDKATAIKEAVETELTELKTSDPKLDENALFQHANKYGFNSLKTAHANMVDMKKSAVDVEKRVVKDITKREADPISTGQGAEPAENDGYDPGEMSQFDSAADYLATLKGKK